ncbi:MAG TPA: pentapeptide repeat-containing protein, partial [Beijerinckiaceae bacterium]
RLAGALLRGTTLVRARAPQLRAAGANLAEIRATAADFAGSDFTDADFTRADLRAARFGDALLRRARFLNADLRGADLSRARLEEAALAGARVDCNTRFPRGFDPDGRLLVPLDLCGGRFALDYSGKPIAGLSFAELDVRGAIFAGADVAGADFRGASLDGADFTRARGFGPDFAPASAREAGFEDATGALAGLQGSDLRNARIAGGPAGLEITVDRAGPRLDGATLRRVRIVLDAGEGETPSTGAASLLRAQIEEATLVCQPSGRPGETLELARRLAAANPGVTLAESCRRR